MGGHIVGSRDIERMRANVHQHPWARELFAATRGEALRYRELSRDQLRSYVSEGTPLVSITCEVCHNGAWGAYDVLEQATRLRCRSCGTTWEWDAEDRTEEWNVQALFRYHRLEAVARGCEAMGLVHRVDGDEECGICAGVIVERMAEVFRGYRMSRVNTNEWLDRSDPYYAKIAGWKFREGAILRRVLRSYDLIRPSGVLDDTQLQMIDRELVEYTRDYLLDSYSETGLLGMSSIQDQGYSYWCLCACAILLGDSETLARIGGMFRGMLAKGSRVFYADGTFYEGTWAYQSQLLAGLWSIPEMLQHLPGLDVYGDPCCRLYEKVLTWYLDATFPDGTMPPINDAHVGGRPSADWSEIAWRRYGNRKALRHLKEIWGDDLDGGTEVSLFMREPGEDGGDDPGESYGGHSLHLQGAGQMLLRQGRGPAQTVAFIDYGPYEPSPHKQRDYLNLGLFACGMEMISEIGYSHQPAWVRHWQVCPLAHNTVAEVAGQQHKGAPVLWQITPGAKLAEAGVPPENSRFVALLPRASGEPILVDVFRVHGEQPTYTWAMHARSGDVSINGVGLRPAEVDQPLCNGRRGLAHGEVVVSWQFPGDVPRGLQTIVPCATGATVTMSECPPEEDEIAATHIGGVLKTGAVIPYRGHLQIAVAGPEAVFTAVHIPWKGTPSQIAVRRLLLSSRPWAVALEIVCEAETFLVVHDPEPGVSTVHGLELNGRAAVARFDGAQIRGLCMAGGTAARCDAVEVTADAGGNGFWEA